MNKMKIALAQLNFLVGDIAGNTEKILTLLKDSDAALIVFPELALTGYPIEDLVFREKLHEQIEHALQILLKNTALYKPALLLGLPTKNNQKQYYNQAVLIHQGKIVAEYQKQCLPNYAVFDEKRYFTPGTKTVAIDFQGFKLGLLICEDLWFKEPIAKLKQAEAELVLVLNASPFHRNKSTLRHQIIQARIQETQLPVAYCNLIGGQDELVFDGGSVVYNDQGQLLAQASYFKEDILSITLEKPTTQQKLIVHPAKITEKPNILEMIYRALVLGVRDYIQKNHFPGALIGLSGGIDSALTLAIAVDAIGAEKITGVLMPSRYTAPMSNEDAIQEAETLQVPYKIIPIEKTFNAFIHSLEAIKIAVKNITLENLQARCRGTLLMALSNNTGAIVLTTGNKSELAVGYSTLYGDMAGGFCVLKDVPKTLVYQLAEYRNRLSSVIPERVLTRAPSAELALNQKDQDSLPPYNELDEIILRYIEQDQSIEQIETDTKIEKTIIEKVVTLINRNEYKRRQAPIGINITERAFGKDRRYPITSSYR